MTKNFYPDMPPALDGEDVGAYTDRVTGADKTGRVPYDHYRWRQCSIGYHEECSMSRGRPEPGPNGKICECPCHDDEPAQAEDFDGWDFGVRLARLLQRVSFMREGQWLACFRDQADPEGRYYLQVQSLRPDAATGEDALGKGGKAYLSPYATDSEIVRKAFQLFLAYNEHEVREFFRLDDRAIFGPHIDVEALWLAADQLDIRKAPES